MHGGWARAVSGYGAPALSRCLTAKDEAVGRLEWAVAHGLQVRDTPASIVLLTNPLFMEWLCSLS